jgi:hypothetical protein
VAWPSVDEQLAALQRELVDTKGDGNCVFYSVAHQLGEPSDLVSGGVYSNARACGELRAHAHAYLSSDACSWHQLQCYQNAEQPGCTTLPCSRHRGLSLSTATQFRFSFSLPTDAWLDLNDKEGWEMLTAMIKKRKSGELDPPSADDDVAPADDADDTEDAADGSAAKSAADAKPTAAAAAAKAPPAKIPKTAADPNGRKRG